jgi:ribonuclease Y
MFNILSLSVLAALVIGSGTGYLLSTHFQKNKKRELEFKTARLIQAAKNQIIKVESEISEVEIRLKRRISDLDASYQDSFDGLKKRIELKESSLQKREQKNAERQQVLEQYQAEMTSFKISSAQKREMLENALTEKAALTLGEAKEEILANLENEARPYHELVANKLVENTKENANKESIHILKSIMQKYSEPSSVDHLDKTLKVTKDAVKGKIIGRGAKNLVYLEEKTGADIIFEDEAGIITVSCFNLVIQETVRMTLQKLMREPVINPEVIDRVYETARVELDKKLEQIGIKASEVIGIEKRDPELMKLIGRLKYRTSYGQNILYHSLEIAYFSALMAAEIGADIEIAKIGGFFHDIGKAIDQEVPGSHDYLGKEILEKFGYSWEIVHAAWTHHDAIPIETVEAQIVKAADAISAGRPGARTESAQMYVERIQGLEKIALSTEGVKKAFALSAGRELRTIIDENKVSDEMMIDLAQKMANEIEQTLAYPGKIKVNLIRTLEAIDFANKGATKSTNPTKENE